MKTKGLQRLMHSGMDRGNRQSFYFEHAVFISKTYFHFGKKLGNFFQ